MNFHGGAKATLVNNGWINSGVDRPSVIDVHVKGHGEIAIGYPTYGSTSDSSGLTGVPNLWGPSSVEFGQAVDRGQIVAFSGTATPLTPETLLLDKPGQFQATIYNFGSPPGPNNSIANTVIAMPNEDIRSDKWHNGVLSLYDARHDDVADLHLAGSYAQDQFIIGTSGWGSAVYFNPVHAMPLTHG
jgi:hypothetical protein